MSAPKVVQEIESDAAHHLTGSFLNADAPTPPPTPASNGHLKKTNGTSNATAARRRKAAVYNPALPPRQGFVKDIMTLRWMRVPSSSFKGIILTIVLWANWQLLTPTAENPFASFLFISHRIPETDTKNPMYQKGYLDLVFIAYYILVFSFVRQFVTIHIFERFAKWWGIPPGKRDRFGEQGYALLYFGFFGAWGVLIMRELPTWWYKTEHFWIDYPHWRMPGQLKCYYLLQSAYWVQQFLVLVLGLEKPRSDFTELCIHHVVTLWLIGWSYLINLTRIGNAVFFSMDIPDTFLALTKLFNYMDLSAKNVIYPIFLALWSYFRHYINLVILQSTWTEFHLMPESSKQWNPPTGAWMAPWMQYQIFIPIALLQVVNLFWYVLMWRILFRAVFGSGLDDSRSDDEEDTKED